jgi:hypothetical protein
MHVFADDAFGDALSVGFIGADVFATSSELVGTATDRLDSEFAWECVWELAF